MSDMIHTMKRFLMLSLSLGLLVCTLAPAATSARAGACGEGQ